MAEEDMLDEPDSGFDNEPEMDDTSEAMDDYDFDDFSGDSAEEEAGNPEVDLTAQGFPEVAKRFEDVPHEVFQDPAYYRTALSNEGDIAKRVHSLLEKYLTAKDPKDRSVFRMQIISLYWELLRGVAKKASGKIPEPKRFLLRFNVLHHNLINAETKAFFSKLVTENELNQPVYYIDEWLKAIGTGQIRPSTTDEVQVARNNTRLKLRQLLEKASGKLEGSKTLLKAKDQERQEIEENITELLGSVAGHYPLEGFNDVNECYTDSQKRAIADIQELLKGLLRSDRELNNYVKDYYQAESDVQTLTDKLDLEDGESIVDTQAIDSEFDTIRQAAKMTIGRQGNHFPILTGEYFHCGPADVGFRENIITMLAWIESIDSEAFYRHYRNRYNRIVPFVLLIPSYGDTGICWEPFDKHNRAASRGRIFIPMYPKNLYVALLSAVADLRWQVAKEKAAYYWMEEGLTGNYYQWFAAQKLRGDVKEYFIQDYILWMTKEAEGIQKLDKEIRGIFWRYMPFSKEVKEKLNKRSYVYQELCQRDKNREMSDGY